MRVSVKKNTTVMEDMEVELPYYYKYDLRLDTCDSTIYGKLEEHRHTAVQITDRYGGNMEYEFSTEATPITRFGCYLVDEYRSSKGEYLLAIGELVHAVSVEVAST